ncbi:hypothetical protein HHK36_022614 [Tetracentron sinense]|uniref:40S ribosomal protein S15 n=1 Tax=Tetracentron sinense TaxID=13715 RepID=A0A834YV66_TETSI|nr:hypothetical protein HHK36_022614 [Tetracentron sinense]
MADIETDVAPGQPKRRTFKKFSFRGVDLDALLDMSTDELVKLFNARARRRFQRGLKRKPMALIKKLRKATFELYGASGGDTLLNWSLTLVVYCILYVFSSNICSFELQSNRDGAWRSLYNFMSIRGMFDEPKARFEGNTATAGYNYIVAKREAPPGEKPEPVRTHLRNMIIVPEMIGSIIGVYNGKTFNQVEIKPEMIGHYLAEFSISYKPVKHGRPGIGATHSSRFIPLK